MSASALLPAVMPTFGGLRQGQRERLHVGPGSSKPPHVRLTAVASGALAFVAALRSTRRQPQRLPQAALSLKIAASNFVQRGRLAAVGPWRRPWRPRAAALALLSFCCFALRAPAPVLASGGMSAVAAPVVGTLAQRAAMYTGMCGSLPADLAVALASFVVFGFCAGTETAITTLWPWKVREFAQKERMEAEQDAKNGTATAKRGVRMWTALREDIQRFLQTILIGATLSSVISTAFITEICGKLFGPKGLAIATISVSLVMLTFGEIIPKSMAVSSPLTFAKAALPIFYSISKFVYPVSKGLNYGIAVFLSVFGISVDTNKTPYVSEEELDLIFASAMQSGIVDAEEGQMIRSVRNLDSKSVKEVMTPLVDMMCISGQEPISTLHQLCLDTQFSRVPVYNERFDSIIGVVSLKTLLKHARLDETHSASGSPAFEELRVDEICDKPFFVPETQSLLTALRSLKERTLAICVDEYGGTTGLITLEDVLEEIVGEIYDPEEEKDKRERAVNRTKIQSLGGGRFRMDATTDVDDVTAILSIEMPDGDYNSIGGFLCNAVDRIPKVGEAVTCVTAKDSVRFEVLEVDDRKVLTIEAYSLKLERVERRMLEESERGSGETEGPYTLEQAFGDDEEGPAAVLEVILESSEAREQQTSGGSGDEKAVFL